MLNLILLGWVKFWHSIPAAIMITVVTAVPIVVWVVHTRPKWGRTQASSTLERKQKRAGAGGGGGVGGGGMGSGASPVSMHTAPSTVTRGAVGLGMNAAPPVLPAGAGSRYHASPASSGGGGGDLGRKW